MYLKGMGQDDGYYPDFPIDTGVGLPTGSDQFPTISGDWTGLVKTALTTWGNVESLKTNLEIQRAQALPARTSPSLLPARSAGFSPFPASMSGSSGATILLLVAAGIAAFIYFRR